MSDDNERKWIHPAVFGVLEASDEMRDCLDKRKGEEASIVVLLNKISKWKADNRPLLTPRAHAVLEAVEGLEEHCRECKACIPCHSGRDGTRYDIAIINACAAVLHDDIRRAIREKP